MKRYFKYFLSFSLVFICLISTPTFGKYFTRFSGLAWVLNFNDDFAIIGDIFIAEDENFKEDENGNPFAESEKLWGAADEEGKVTSPNDEYNMGNLSGVFYEAYNNTNIPLLIMFDLEYCAPTSNNALTGGGIIFNVSNITYPKPNGVSASFGTPILGEIVVAGANETSSDLANVSATRDSEVSFSTGSWFFKTDYYLHSSLIDPRVTIGNYFGTATYERGEGLGAITSSVKFTSSGVLITKEFIEENFVLYPDRSASYNIATDYQGFLGGDGSLNSCYATVKMVAIPYTG